MTELSDEPIGPLGHSTSEIAVDGQLRAVETLRHGRYHALRFEHESLVVTAVNLNQMPERLTFVRLADVEPFLAHNVDDLEVVQAWLRSQRNDGQ